ncbi:hypothetical protein KR054_010362 [Drosophila jambulina]|nr:hypothetical protein KR054_010362 [Drosophila jambulina]
MRFLLLCPAALLLLIGPAAPQDLNVIKPVPVLAAPSDHNVIKPVPVNPTDSSLKITTPVIEKSKVSPDDKPGRPVLNSADRRRVRKLRRRLAEAQTELRVLQKKNTILNAKLEFEQAGAAQLVLSRKDLASKLEASRREFQKAKDELSTEGLQGGISKPTESELAKLIDEETRKQLDERKAEIRHSYENRFDKILEELGKKFTDELKLLATSAALAFSS